MRRSLLLVLASAAASIFGFANSILLARVLEVADFGELRSALALLYILQLVVTLGTVQNVAIASVSMQRQQCNSLVILGGLSRYSLFRAVLSGGILFVALLVAARLGVSGSKAILASGPIGYAGLLIGCCLYLAPLYLQEIGRAQGILYAQIASLSLPSLLTTVLLLVLPSAYSTGPFEFFFGIAIVTGLPAFLILCFKVFETRDLEISKTWFGEVIRTVAPDARRVAGSVILGSTTTQFCLLVLGWVSGSKEAAVFSLGLSFALPLLIIPNAIASAEYPKMVSSGDYESKTILYVWWIGTGQAVALALILSYVVRLLFPEQYWGAYWPAVIMSIGLIFRGVGDFYNRVIVANGGGRESMLLASISLVLGLVGTLLAGHFLGATGAAITKAVVDFAYWAGALKLANSKPGS